MNTQEKVAALNAHQPAFLQALGGQVVGLDDNNMTVEMRFDIGVEFCHTVNIVQGGFVTAMLDAAMSHAVFSFVPDAVSVATLEVKVSFLEPSLAGGFRCLGHIQKAGRSLVFLTGELYNADGLLTATATSTAKLVKQK